jgi:hypothetical protein
MSTPPGVILPDHSTAAGAGDGMPIHTEEYGQSVYLLNPNDPTSQVTDTSSLHPGKYLTVLTLDRIFQLIASMVESIQKVAITQSERLTFLTKWQTAYTDKMAGMHNFVSQNGDPSFVSAQNDDASKVRQDLNQTNSTYTEQMRAARAIVADAAKAHQSVVNQSNDAVNQQSNMATSLIQQFSTILGSIYR